MAFLSTRDPRRCRSVSTVFEKSWGAGTGAKRGAASYCGRVAGTAMVLSAEYLVPVVVFGGSEISSAGGVLSRQEEVVDPGWLSTRQIAVTAAIETSPLNQERRRARDKSGALYLGWQPDLEQSPGNHLMLAWSSPLPLKRIRDFSARCPELIASGPDIDSLASDVGAQGISVAQWRFAVK